MFIQRHTVMDLEVASHHTVLYEPKWEVTYADPGLQFLSQVYGHFSNLMADQYMSKLTKD